MTQSATQCRVVSQAGTVVTTRGDYADIEILQQSACAACTLRGVCRPGEGKMRLVRARVGVPIAPGDRVSVELDVRRGRLGVFVSYVLPLAVVVGTLFVLRPVVSREAIAGVAAIATLVPYYGLLYVLRGFFERTMALHAVPIHKEGAV